MGTRSKIPAAGTNRGKKSPVPSAGKSRRYLAREKVAGTKRGKKSPVPSAGKRLNSANREKTHCWCRARETMKLEPSAEKYADGAQPATTGNM